MNIIKELMPYIASIITAIISGFVSYMKSKREFEIQIESVKINNKHDIDKLMEQHKLDIENIKEKHKLEMEAKDKDHKHEKELLELKSKNSINEHGQEVMNNAMASVLEKIMGDMVSGKVKAEDLNKLSKSFSNKQ